MRKLRKTTIRLGLLGTAAVAGCFFSPNEHPAICTPGKQEPCYSGQPGTRDEGACKAGTVTCGADGLWGACVGEVLPAAEDCTTSEDEDCDGQGWSLDGDEECICEPGTTQACYTGPEGTEGTALCKGGTWTCNDDGLGWGACEGEVIPAAENCATEADEDCDGQGWTPELDTDCACVPGTTSACYTGPSGTEGIGACHGGTKMCKPDGLTFDGCVGEVLPTTEVCGNAVLDEDCTGAPCGGDALWALKAGGSGEQVAQDLAVDSAGNILVVGSFDSTLVLGGVTLTSQGGDDAFVAKLDGDGNLLWVQQLGGPSDQFAMSVAVDTADNVFVAGFFAGSMTAVGIPLIAVGSNDAFALKLDPNGTLGWVRTFGDNADQRAMGIAVTGQGDPVLTGRFHGLLNFGDGIGTLLTSAGNADVFVACLSSNNNGAHLWSNRFGDNAYQRGRSIAASGDGVYLTGDVIGSFAVASDSINAGTHNDVLALKVETNGSPAWGQSFGGVSSTSDKFGHDIALDGTGKVLLTGQFAGIVDFGGGSLIANGANNGFVARLTEAGGYDWSTSFGTSNTLKLVSRSIDADALNNILLIGEFSGTADFGGGPLTSAGNKDDLFVAKLAPNGGHLWSRRFGDAEQQIGRSIAIDPAGDVLITGDFEGTLDFNTAGTSLTANDDKYTLFIAKLAK